MTNPKPKPITLEPMNVNLPGESALQAFFAAACFGAVAVSIGTHDWMSAAVGGVIVAFLAWSVAKRASFTKPLITLEPAKAIAYARAKRAHPGWSRADLLEAAAGILENPETVQGNAARVYELDSPVFGVANGLDE